MAHSKKIRYKRYIDKMYTDIDEAIDESLRAKANKEAISIGVVCNAVDLLQRLIDRNIIPDTLTDQTSAHDELIGYFPARFDGRRSKNY
jgi:urocanate hydratase